MRKYIYIGMLLGLSAYYVFGGLELRQFAGPKSGLSFNPWWPVDRVFGKECRE